ncbi:hypothetical protein KI387_028412, partial [Taxus chinensis]
MAEKLAPSTYPNLKDNDDSRLAAIRVKTPLSPPKPYLLDQALRHVAAKRRNWSKGLIMILYHAFRLYYFAMFTIMGVLGFLNGFVLLPVLLTWLGPPPLPHATRERASTINGKNGKESNGKVDENSTRPDDDSVAYSNLPMLANPGRETPSSPVIATPDSTTPR